VSDPAFSLFDEMLLAWRAQHTPPLERHLRVFALMMELLMEVLHPETLGRRSDLPAQPWWDIEAKLREDLSQPIDLRTLEHMSHSSQRSIIRACELATGSSPMKRVKELRMSYARGLVLYSQMSMTEIAMRVGYGRVQEFSRDYRSRFGQSPREDRKLGPDYQEQQVPQD
jgi:AraC-like DNA-binding protein